MTPRRPRERIKNDRRDSIALARLPRAGELTYVWVPDLLHEAIRDLLQIRDLVRARHSAVVAAVGEFAARRPRFIRNISAHLRLERNSIKLIGFGRPGASLLRCGQLACVFQGELACFGQLSRWRKVAVKRWSGSRQAVLARLWGMGEAAQRKCSPPARG